MVPIIIKDLKNIHNRLCLEKVKHLKGLICIYHLEKKNPKKKNYLVYYINLTNGIILGKIKKLKNKRLDFSHKPYTLFIHCCLQNGTINTTEIQIVLYNFCCPLPLEIITGAVCKSTRWL